MKRRSCRDRDAHDASCVKLREALLEVADDRRAGKRRGCDHSDRKRILDRETYDLQAVELGVCEDCVEEFETLDVKRWRWEVLWVCLYVDFGVPPIYCEKQTTEGRRDLLEDTTDNFPADRL